MKSKQDVEGGVSGQIAGRDITNHDPTVARVSIDSPDHSTVQNSNVVSISVGGHPGEPALSGKCLSSHQKAVLSKLVEQIVSVSGLEPLEVWNPLLARASADKVRLIPVERYVDLEQYLRDWLRRARSERAVDIDDDDAPAVGQRVDAAVPAPTSSRPIKVLAVSQGLLFAIVAIHIAMSNDSPFADGASTQPMCHFSGAQYSLGARLLQHGKLMRCEGLDGDAARWELDVRPNARKSGV